MGSAYSGPIVAEVSEDSDKPVWQIFLNLGEVSFKRAATVPLNLPPGMTSRLRRIDWIEWMERKAEVELPLPFPHEFADPDGPDDFADGSEWDR